MVIIIVNMGNINYLLLKPFFFIPELYLFSHFKIRENFDLYISYFIRLMENKSKLYFVKLDTIVPYFNELW